VNVFKHPSIVHWNVLWVAICLLRRCQHRCSYSRGYDIYSSLNLEAQVVWQSGHLRYEGASIFCLEADEGDELLNETRLLFVALVSEDLLPIGIDSERCGEAEDRAEGRKGVSGTEGLCGAAPKADGENSDS